eukprot:366008-Chlamydomonas_euryale.AAC.7
MGDARPRTAGTEAGRSFADPNRSAAPHPHARRSWSSTSPASCACTTSVTSRSLHPRPTCTWTSSRQTCTSGCARFPHFAPKWVCTLTPLCPKVGVHACPLLPPKWVCTLPPMCPKATSLDQALPFPDPSFSEAPCADTPYAGRTVARLSQQMSQN